MASNKESLSGRNSSPTCSPTRTSLPDGSRAFSWPLAVITVTIWVVPRYSAPITHPQHRGIGERHIPGSHAKREFALGTILEYFRHVDSDAVDLDAAVAAPR